MLLMFALKWLKVQHNAMQKRPKNHFKHIVKRMDAYPILIDTQTHTPKQNCTESESATERFEYTEHGENDETHTFRFSFQYTQSHRLSISHRELERYREKAARSENTRIHSDWVSDERWEWDSDEKRTARRKPCAPLVIVISLSFGISYDFDVVLKTHDCKSFASGEYITLNATSFPFCTNADANIRYTKISNVYRNLLSR